MNRDEKAAVIDEIAAQIGEAEAIFAVDYRGITVTEAAELRGQAARRRRHVSHRQELAHRARGGQGRRREPEGAARGPDGVHVRPRRRGGGGEGAVATSPAATTALQLQGRPLGAEELSVEQITSIARLPAREVLHAQLVGTIAAPITGLVRGLNALIAGIAIQLRQMPSRCAAPGRAAPAGEAPRGRGCGAEAAPEAEAEAPAEEPAEAEVEARR